MAWAAALSGLAGAGAGAGSGIGEAALQENYAEFNAKKAWDRYQYAQVMRYPWLKQSLEMAGYNPMLAVGANASVPNPAMAPTPNVDVGGPALRGFEEGSSFAGKMISTAKQASTLEDMVDTVRARKDEAFANADEARTRADLLQDHGLDRMEADIRNMNSASAMRLMQGMLMDSQRQQTNANTGLLGVRMRLERAGLSSAESRAEFDKSKIGQWMNYIDRAIDVSPGINQVERLLNMFKE